MAAWTRAPLLLALVCVAAVAHADTARPSDPAAAEALFTEAKGLMDAQRFNEACPKLEASMRLDPGTGTLLNLALCHEATGKTATAWAEFREVAMRSERAGRRDRVELARQHAATLLARLSYLTITVAPAAHFPGLSIELDGLVRPDSALTNIPVDPGKHHVTASAPGKKPFAADVEVGVDGEKREVTIEALEVLPQPAPVAPSPAPTEASGSRTAAWTTAGIGVAALATGAVFGGLALSAKDHATRDCPDKVNCSEHAHDESTSALLFANVSNVGIGAGVLLAGVSAYLFATSPVVVAPRLSTQGASLVAEGTF